MPFSITDFIYAFSSFCLPSFPREELKDGIHVYYPTNCDLEKLEGAFILDSFEYMKRGSKGKEQVRYMVQLLNYVFLKTRRVFMAVTCPGCTLVDPVCNRTFEHLLKWVPNSVENIVAIVCANDWYNNWRNALSSNICSAAKSFCFGVK